MGYGAPFPYFGGKSRIAPLVWSRLGDVTNFVDPFFGSGSLLFGRPEWDWSASAWQDDTTRIETVNDADGFVTNAWRAMQAAPDLVAEHADWPVNENDLHARHSWLVGQRASLTARLEGDAAFYDAKIAGWWIWGMCCWIGGGFCSGDGSWVVEDGQLVHLGGGRGVQRKLVHLGDAGQGVQRQLVHLGDAGQGVQRKRVHLHNEQGVTRHNVDLDAWFTALSARLRRVRVCSGDWMRVLGPTPTVKLGITGIVLDPPYAQDQRHAELYAIESPVSAAVREWAISHGEDERLRIALFGYDGEHQMPDSWECVPWKAHGGYGSQGEGDGRVNAERERVWFSPYCLRAEKVMDLFDFAGVAL